MEKSDSADGQRYGSNTQEGQASIDEEEDNPPNEDNSPRCRNGDQGISEAVRIVIHAHVVGTCESHDGRFVFDLC